MAKIQRVLISVTDKTGIVEFARDAAGAGSGTDLHRAARRG